MRRFYASLFFSAILVAPVARADESEAALEKRIEKKVVTQHQVTNTKVSGKNVKEKMEAKADRHENSVKGASGHGGKPVNKVPPKKPPSEKPKPTPPPHH